MLFVFKRAFARFVVEVSKLSPSGKPAEVAQAKLAQCTICLREENMVAYHCLVVTYSFDGKKLRLSKPYFYKDKDSLLSRVPAGFEFDGSSVPWIVWAVLGESPTRGPHVHAIVVHDYTYEASSVDVTRKESDDLYYNMCIEHGVSSLKARFMWLALRVFAVFLYRERDWNM